MNNPFNEQSPEKDPKLIQVDLEPEFYIPPPKPKTPILIGEAAYYGFAGDWARATAPQSESNLDSLLLQFEVVAGVLFGRYFYTFLDREIFPNLFLVMLGPSGAARKGGALYAARKFFENAAPDWSGNRGNWKSGEGLIHFARDPVYGLNRKRERELKDEGISDKRILIEETELIHLFRMGQRDGNTLTSTLRDVWDSPLKLHNTSKGSAATATGVHGGLIGHMTKEEFLLVDPGLISNGLINRITWGNAFQSQKIDDAQPLTWSVELFDRFREIYVFATGKTDVIVGAPERPQTQYVPLNDEAKLFWKELYHNLPVYPGTLAVVCERYCAQLRKFALIYAILDMSPEILPAHLRAAKAIADYSKANAIDIFQSFSRNPNANKLLHALQRNPQGLHKGVIQRTVFNNKLSSDEIHAAVLELLENDLISFQGKVIGAKTT